MQHLPPEGLREMCSWERFCAFAREPETRKVAVDARVSVAGVRYEVDPELAGETVTLWFGLYDDQLYVEHGDRRYGPYAPHRRPDSAASLPQLQENPHGEAGRTS